MSARPPWRLQLPAPPDAAARMQCLSYVCCHAESARKRRYCCVALTLTLFTAYIYAAMRRCHCACRRACRQPYLRVKRRRCRCREQMRAVTPRDVCASDAPRVRAPRDECVYFMRSRHAEFILCDAAR